MADRAEYGEEVRRLRAISRQMEKVLGVAVETTKMNKPNDRSEMDRYYAILITDLEKALAFYKTYLHVD